jgi:energy-coupling factor transporter ATP-binding protein EcfA2
MLSFQKRLLSLASNSSPTVLSISEVSDLYHFPFTRVTQTENIIKAHSKELPAPVSLKKGRIMDSVFGVNTYGGTNTEIGLTEEERQTHMYILGRTGSGKTTLMFTMAKHDIETGKGLVFIDPHGDVSEDLVASVPLSRKDDLIYVNPTDLKHPIGINLLELTPGLDEDEAELEKEVVAEGMVSLFRKVFSKEENTNAHRIEYILRNTIYTAFTTEGCTIFTINKILTNPTFRKQVVSRLKDPDLVDFWKYEFGKAGDYQVVKMTQGVTAKVGRFLRSPTARRILEQEKSTINFDDIINQGKILICNFSQKLGEDTSRLLGTTIMTKLQQAALKRAYIPENERKTFYLYVDEFQNFATQSFTKMVTEGRKYRMPLIIAEQSTSQQKDRDITNIILANITTVVSFRSGNYIDEDLMLNQFAPYLEKGEIMNLPRYKFYIKISAIESEEPFSGTTLYFPVVKDAEKIEQLIEASRKNWAIDYKRKTESEVSVPVIEKTISTTPIHNDQTKKRNGFPESIR